MKRIFTLLALCISCVQAFAQSYFPGSVSAPYAGTAQSVCQNSPNTATSVTYTICGNSAGSLLVTPKWYLNGTLVYTDNPFTPLSGGGTITLPAAAFNYTAAGAFTGTAGLFCRLTWTPVSPGACGATTSVDGLPDNITVISAPGPISGASTVCTGATTTLGNSSLAGTWSGNANPIATVGLNSGIVSGVAPGNVTITFANNCGPAAQTTMVIIAPPAAITGQSFVCSGSTITLSETVTSGTWYSSNPAVASIYPFNRTVYGYAEGTANIMYSTGCGAAAVFPIQVRVPPAGITGTNSLCAGSSAGLGNASSYGTWSSSNSTVATIVNTSGFITGATVGTTDIRYSTGCGIDATLSFTVAVTPVSPAPITGNNVVCFGNTTPLSDVMIGGSWSSNNITIAIINSIGEVTGVNLGSTTITYSITNGCGTAYVTFPMTVSNLAAPGVISGPSSVCGGGTIHLTNSVPSGVWSSSNTAAATVDTVGIVTGVAPGTTTITYTIANACSSAFSTYTVSTTGTMPVAPASITGAANMCIGSDRRLSNATPGGVWSSTNPGAATVSNLGILTALNAGSTIISYSIINSCGAAAKTATVTVSVPPNAGSILGPGTVCAGDTAQLTSTSFGGIWTSSDSSTIKPLSNGKMIGKSLGAATITYTVGNACGIDSRTFSMSVVGFGACATGLNAAEGADDLKIYPNPSNGTFTVNGSLSDGDQATIEVANMLGQVVYKGTANAQWGMLHHNVAVSNLTDGVYLVTIRSGAAVKSLRMTISQH